MGKPASVDDTKLHRDPRTRPSDRGARKRRAGNRTRSAEALRQELSHGGSADPVTVTSATAAHGDRLTCHHWSVGSRRNATHTPPNWRSLGRVASTNRLPTKPNACGTASPIRSFTSAIEWRSSTARTSCAASRQWASPAHDSSRGRTDGGSTRAPGRRPGGLA